MFLYTTAGPYRVNPLLKKWVRKAMAIGFLPLAVVRINFRLMTTARDTRRLTRAFPPLNDFVVYMEHTYVGENATFPPAVWNVHRRGSDSRTNNRIEGKTYYKLINDLIKKIYYRFVVYICCIYTIYMIVSGFHNRWNSSLDRRHPSLWVFIRRLKDEQRLVETVCALAERGERPPPVRRKWRRQEERLKRLRRQYRRDERTLEQYWAAVQHLIVNFE